jgi:hypothetical protein
LTRSLQAAERPAEEFVERRNAMTLVLSCLTPNYVIQVSDQRITRIADGALIDDLRNKGTMFCAEMGFGYTGLAEINGAPTDRWLAEVLASERTLQAGLTALGARATEAFRTISLPPRQKRHAFVGVGFCRPLPASELSACEVTVSNFLSPDGEWTPEAKPNFEIQGTLRREDRPFTLCRPVGAVVPGGILLDLRRSIRACLSHKTGPLEVMRLMAVAVRKVADLEPTVGKALLIIFVPREAVEKNPILFVTPVAPSGFSRLDTPTFLHIPAHAADPYWDLPNFVCNGMVMSGAFEQGGASDSGAAPAPDTELDQETYRRFLVHSEEVNVWADFVRSLGVTVDGLGLLSRDLDMLRRAGITTAGQIERLLQKSESWGRRLLAEYYSTWFADVIGEGKLSLVRSGVVVELLVANYPTLFTPEVLLHVYGWGFPDRFLSIAARHQPRAEVGGG